MQFKSGLFLVLALMLVFAMVADAQRDCPRGRRGRRGNRARLSAQEEQPNLAQQQSGPTKLSNELNKKA